MVQTVHAEKNLEILKKRTHLVLSLNDIRIILGCFNVAAYQAEIDDESYLDQDALQLRSKLELMYAKMLKENGSNGGPR